MRIHDAVAVVTGGASGLGQGVAELLASLGAHVDVYDLHPAQDSTPVDVTSPEQVQAAIRGTVSAHGRLDIVVHCAGIGYAGRMLPKDLSLIHI